MKPLCSFYGGKQRLAAQIIDWFPRHTVYCEPYCGGAAVFFARTKPAPSNHVHYREVLNDHDERIMMLYRVAQDAEMQQALLHRLSYTPYSRAEYQKAMDIIRTGWSEADQVTLAWAMVVNLRQSFSNKIDAGWSTSVSTRNHASTWSEWQECLPTIFERLRGVYLECDDARKVIQRWDSPQTLYYVDPPYVGANQGHYSGFTGEDLQALVDTLEQCQGSFILSGYHPQITMPDTWEHRTIAAHCSASGQGQVKADRTRLATTDELGDRQRTEHLWRVDRSTNMRPELQALFTPRTSQLSLL